MKIALQIFSWIAIVLGALAIIDSGATGDFYAFTGGALFLTLGILAIIYIKDAEIKISKK